MLTGPLNAFPWALNGLVESFVSLKRVDKFLKLSTFNDGLYYSDMNEIVDAEIVPNTVLGKIAKNIIFLGKPMKKNREIQVIGSNSISRNFLHLTIRLVIEFISFVNLQLYQKPFSAIIQILFLTNPSFIWTE